MISFNTFELVITRNYDGTLIAKPKVKDFISDHAAIICHLRSFKPKPKPTEFCYRKIKDIDLSSFKKEIIQSNILQNSTEDLGGLEKQYNDTLLNILETCTSKKPTSLE